MPTTSGFTHTPVSLCLILTTIGGSVLSTLMDVKYLLPIRPTPHIYPYLQLSRVLSYQLAYTNSSELLFGTVLIYHLRVLERLWGSRKFLSFVLAVYGTLAVVTPVLVGLLSLLSRGWYNYLPAGATGLVVAGVACWSDEVPVLYRYRVVLPGTTVGDDDAPAAAGGGRSSGGGGGGVTLSDKSTVYVLAAQLALSQFPYNLLPAGVGWVVGSAWRADLLPAGVGRWRCPRWMVGEGRRGKSAGAEERYAGLRRRLEEEGASHGSVQDGMRSGLSTAQDRGQGGQPEATRRRGIGGMVREYFRGIV